MFKYKNKIWDLSITRNQSVFHTCLAASGAALYSKLFFVPVKDEINIVSELENTGIYTNNKNLNLYTKALEKICLDTKLLNKVTRIYDRLIKNLEIASNNLLKNDSKKNFETYLNCYSQLTAGLFFTAIFGRHVSVLLKSKLNNLYPNLSSGQIDVKVSELSYPKINTPLTLSQVVLLKLAVKIKKQKIQLNKLNTSKLSKEFKDLQKKFRAIPVNYNGDPWTEQDFLNQLKNTLKDNPNKTLKDFETNHKLRTKTMQKQVALLPTEYLKKLSYGLQTCTTYNEKRKFAICNAVLVYRPLFILVAKKYNIKNWKMLRKLTPKEFIDLAFNNKAKYLKVAKNRKTSVVISDSNNGYKLLKYIKLQQKERLNTTKYSSKSEVSGIIANIGRVVGTAKIVMNSQDFFKFEPGDILITAMTSVDFVPLMKIASAFVTNEGGVTSHASIVSRELNKPCIIGTKIATKVFKDGDVVEVDANNGVVRKIK